MKLLLFILTSFSLAAHAAQLKCEYNFMGSPMGNVTLDLTDGKPGERAMVSLFFSGNREVLVSNETPRAGEYLYMILSKEDPSNEVHMILYPPSENTFQSKLINESTPVGKELQGTCQFL